MARDYELMYIVRPDVDDEGLQQAMNDVQGIVEAQGGTVVSTNPWGKRRLAYEIEHLRDGHYVILHIQLEPPKVREIERVLHIQDHVFRHLVTVWVDKPEGEIGPGGDGGDGEERPRRRDDDGGGRRRDGDDGPRRRDSEHRTPRPVAVAAPAAPAPAAPAPAVAPPAPVEPTGGDGDAGDADEVAGGGDRDAAAATDEVAGGGDGGPGATDEVAGGGDGDAVATHEVADGGVDDAVADEAGAHKEDE